MNLFQRINRVMARVEYLQKDDTVKIRTRGGNEFTYQAITHDAVTAAIRGAFVDEGVVSMPTVLSYTQEKVDEKDTRAVRTIAEVEVSFINIEDPKDYFTVKYFGYGDDVGDKGPGKAISYAVKNAYLKCLMLETGESDESRTAQEKRQMAMGEAIRNNAEAIAIIQKGIASGDLTAAAEVWFEIPEEEQRAMWVAPSKGGPFTTEERKMIKTTEFREAFFGPGEDDAKS